MFLSKCTDMCLCGWLSKVFTIVSCIIPVLLHNLHTPQTTSRGIFGMGGPCQIYAAYWRSWIGKSLKISRIQFLILCCSLCVPLARCDWHTVYKYGGSSAVANWSGTCCPSGDNRPCIPKSFGHDIRRVPLLKVSQEYLSHPDWSETFGNH